MKLVTFIVSILFLQSVHAYEVVPFSVNSIKPIGSGYVELLGPGRIEINKKIQPYTNRKFINVKDIGTLSTVTGTTGCILTYSSGSYTENISILKQTCDEVILIIKKSK